MKKFSIIIPTYNVDLYINDCLKSVLNQNFRNYEILIIDDGSTDCTLQTISNSFNSENIKVITQKHDGISIARNNGLRNSSGQYIIFVDSDDYLEKGILAELDNYNDDIVKFNVHCSNGNMRFIQPTFSPITGLNALKMFCQRENIFATPWGYMFKKSIFFNFNLFFLEYKTHEDFGLIPLVVLEASTVRSIPFVGYNYIKRKGSITLENTDSKEIRRMNDFIDQFCFVMSYIYKRDIPNNYKEVYYSYFIKRLTIKFNNFKENINLYKDYEKEVNKCKMKINLFLTEHNLTYQ